MTCFENDIYTLTHEGLLIDVKYLLCNVYLGVTLNGCFLIEPNGTITGSEFPSLKDFLVVVKGRPEAQDYWICEHCEALIDSRLQEGAYAPHDAWANGQGAPWPGHCRHRRDRRCDRRRPAVDPAAPAAL